ncbi:MAG: hypothetical protein BME94_03465 [Methanobacteriales archaeon Met13]
MYNDILRKKICRRFQTMTDSDDQSIYTNLAILLNFLKDNPIKKSILDELKAREIYNSEWTPKRMGGIGGSLDLGLPDNGLDYSFRSLYIQKKMC